MEKKENEGGCSGASCIKLHKLVQESPEPDSSMPPVAFCMHA